MPLRWTLAFADWRPLMFVRASGDLFDFYLNWVKPSLIWWLMFFLLSC